MENAWKYKIDLKDPQAFAKVETLREIRIPKELRQFIEEHNAATPSNYHLWWARQNVCLVPCSHMMSRKQKRIVCIRHWMQSKIRN